MLEVITSSWTIIVYTKVPYWFKPFAADLYIKGHILLDNSYSVALIHLSTKTVLCSYFFNRIHSHDNHESGSITIRYTYTIL